MAAIPPKHRIDFTVTGNAAAKSASLTGPGPLNVAAANWLHQTCTFLGTGTVLGTKGINIKQLGYVVDEHPV